MDGWFEAWRAKLRAERANLRPWWSTGGIDRQKDGRRDERTEGRMDVLKFPLCSGGHRPFGAAVQKGMTKHFYAIPCWLWLKDTTHPKASFRAIKFLSLIFPVPFFSFLLNIFILFLLFLPFPCHIIYNSFYFLSCSRHRHWHKHQWRQQKSPFPPRNVLHVNLDIDVNVDRYPNEFFSSCMTISEYEIYVTDNNNDDVDVDLNVDVNSHVNSRGDSFTQFSFESSSSASL